MSVKINFEPGKKTPDTYRVEIPLSTVNSLIIAYVKGLDVPAGKYQVYYPNSNSRDYPETITVKVEVP